LQSASKQIRYNPGPVQSMSSPMLIFAAEQHLTCLRPVTILQASPKLTWKTVASDFRLYWHLNIIQARNDVVLPELWFPWLVALWCLVYSINRCQIVFRFHANACSHMMIL